MNIAWILAVVAVAAPKKLLFCCFVGIGAWNFGEVDEWLGESIDRRRHTRLNEMCWWCRLRASDPIVFVYIRNYTWFSRDTEFGGILRVMTSVFSTTSYVIFVCFSTAAHRAESVSKRLWTGRAGCYLNWMKFLFMNELRRATAAAAACCCCVESLAERH